MRVLVDNYFSNDAGTPKHYVEIAGDSNDSKPTTGIIGGSLFMETDTGKVYIFDENTSTWTEFPG